MIVLTGEIGIGKTTLLKKVINESKRDFYGILSERFDRGYYVEDAKTGERKILCSEDGTGLKFRKFYFDPEALVLIEESLKRKGDILVYDEIGYLEMEGRIDVLKYVKEPAILIVRKDLVDIISSRFDVVIYEVSRENRKKLKNIILERLEKM